MWRQATTWNWNLEIFFNFRKNSMSLLRYATMKRKRSPCPPPAPLRCRTKVGINWNVTSFGLFKECIVGRTFLSLWEDQTHLLWGNTYSLTILELILSTFSSDLYSINFYLRFVFIYVLLSYNNVSGVCVAGRGTYPDNSNRSLLNSMFKLDEKVNLHPCFCINIVYMVFSRRSDWYAVVLLQH